MDDVFDYVESNRATALGGSIPGWLLIHGVRVTAAALFEIAAD